MKAYYTVTEIAKLLGVSQGARLYCCKQAQCCGASMRTI